MKRFMACATSLVALGMLAAPASASITINEIRIDQPGTDNDEYFELCGDAGESLAGYTYIVLGDGAGASGVIEAVVSLNTNVIPADGHFLAVESTFTLGLANADVVFPAAGNTLNFENTDTVTHILVTGFTGTNGQDLDTNDDGVLDITPWTSVVDSVAVLHGTPPPTGEWPYSTNQVGPDTTFAPGHVYRYADCTGPWNFDAFTAFPAFDTPGSANIPEPASLALLMLGGVMVWRRR